MSSVKFNSSDMGTSLSGVYYRYPISSSDINSSQKNLINSLSSFNSNKDHSKPYIVVVTDPLEYVNDNELDVKYKRRVYSISGTVYNNFTNSYFNIDLGNADLSYIIPPINKSVNNNLSFYYRPVTYVCANSDYEPSPGEIVSTEIPVSGFIYTNSVEGSQRYIPNELFNTDMDMEVSNRYGIEWALSWNNQDSELSSKGFIKTDTWIATYIKGLPSRIKNFVFSGVANENYVRWKYLPTEYTVTARAVLMHAQDNINNRLRPTNLKWIVEGLPLNTEDQHIHSINIVFEARPHNPSDGFEVYKFSDSTFYDSTTGNTLNIYLYDLEGNDIKSTYYIYPNQSMTFTKDRNDFTYIDKSLEVNRNIRYRNFDSDGHISSSTSSSSIKYVFDPARTKYFPEDRIYSFNGVEHYYDRSENKWKTVIPSGVIISRLVTNKYYTYENGRLVSHSWDTEKPTPPPGFIRMDFGTIGIDRHYELFKLIGNKYGNISDNKAKLPDIDNKYLKGTNDHSIVGNTEGSSSTSYSITLKKSNLPTNNYSLELGNTGYTDIGFSSTKGSVSLTGTDTLSARETTPHWHYSGVANDSYNDYGAGPVITSNKKLEDNPSPVGGGYVFPNPPPSIELKTWGSTSSSTTSEHQYPSYMGVTSCALRGLGRTNEYNLDLKVDNNLGVNYVSPVVSASKANHRHTLPTMQFKLNDQASPSPLTINVNPYHLNVIYYISLGQSLVIE